jgi:thiol-disulfide isomerase/thioredoxin
MNHRPTAALIVFLLVSTAGLLAVETIPPRGKLGPGVLAPDFSAFDLAGKEVRLADYRGKVLVLDFWATWCGPCVASMPHTNEVAAKYADQGVVVLAVCTGDKRARFEDWVKLKAKAYPAMTFAFDPHEQGTPEEKNRASFAFYGVSAIPAQFILDREGRIVASTDGYVTGDNRLEAALAQAGVKVGEATIAHAAGTQKKIDAVRMAAPAAGSATKIPPPAFTEDAARLKAGTALAELTLRTVDGTERKTSSYRGHPLVLCLSPAEMIPAEFLDQTVEKYAAQGVQVVALVTRDSAEAYRDWFALHRDRFHFTALLDPSGPEAVRDSAVFLAVGMVVPMPLVLVLDAEGRLLGKVAPKVATSPRGLAELLRRAGVKVDAADLPTPEMFPKAAAPVTAAPAASAAPATVVAAAAAPAETSADRDYAAFVALCNEKPPGKPKEMGGMEKYFVWVDACAKKITADGLAFYAAHPQDARRWEVVMKLVNRPPIFMQGFAPKPGETNQSIADVIVDEPAKRTWGGQVEQLKRALMAATDSKPDQREAVDFQDFAAESRRLRARWKSGEDKDARASWDALVARLDKHIASYVGNPRLGPEVENFLGAWKDPVPTSMEDGCRHFLTSVDEGVRKFAADKLEALGRLVKPLELAFTAVDGRAVDLAQLRGKVVLVDFWATWCGPCKAELPNVVATYRKYHDQGFEVVGIALEDAKLLPGDTADQQQAKLAKARKILTDFTATHDMPWPQHFDGKFWKNEISVQFGIALIPSMFLVDQQGRVVSTNARGEALEREVRRLLKL